MAKISKEEAQKITARVIAKIWTDDEFKKKFIHNPKEILAEEGIETDKNFKVVQNTADTKYFVIPETPDLDKLKEISFQERAAMLLADQIEMF